MSGGDPLLDGLNRFFRGEAGLDATRVALKGLVGADTSAGPRLVALVQAHWRSGRLPPDVARVLAEPGGRLSFDHARPSPAPANGAAGNEGPSLGEDPTTPYRRPAQALPLPAMPPAAAPATGQPAPSDAAAILEGASLTSLVDRFRDLRSATRSGTAGEDGGLGNALADWRALRDRAAAARGGAPPSRSAPGKAVEPLRPGRMLKDRFVLDRLLGRGGMGQVWRAVDRRRLEAGMPQPYVALKLLNPELRRSTSALRALEIEARRAQSMSHPNIVNTHDFDRDADVLFVAMEYLEGRTLQEEVAARGPRQAEDLEVRHLIMAMCAALSYAHAKGIVHYDFKPGNVFITGEGEVKVLDFGIARALREEPGAASADAALTPAYASLEMLGGAPPDPRDDVYGLSCTVYFLLTGRHPFGRRSAREALDQGCVPLCPEGLPRPTWNALERGLALSRATRLEAPRALGEAFAKPARSRIAWLGAR
jgi:predicted Ser/Thr protein kinase